MTPDQHDPRANTPSPRLGRFALAGAAAGALLGASGLIGDLGPGPDACGGAVYGFLLGTILFVLVGRRRT